MKQGTYPLGEENSTAKEGSVETEAHELLAATTDLAGEKVKAARERLSAALDSAKAFAANVRDKAVAGAKAADKAVQEHPYTALAIGVGLGALVGYLLVCCLLSP